MPFSGLRPQLWTASPPHNPTPALVLAKRALAAGQHPWTTHEQDAPSPDPHVETLKSLPALLTCPRPSAALAPEGVSRQAAFPAGSAFPPVVLPPPDAACDGPGSSRGQSCAQAPDVATSSAGTAVLLGKESKSGWGKGCELMFVGFAILFKN